MLPYGDQIESAQDTMVKLSHDILDFQDGYMRKIVNGECGGVYWQRKTTPLGVIHINTPEGFYEYFLDKAFKLINRYGEVVLDFIEELNM